MANRTLRVPLHTQILIGLMAGAAAGVAANLWWGDAPDLHWVVDNVAQPVGQVFLRLLFMVVVPLVFATLALGVANLGDLSRVGRVGAKTLLFFVITTALAASLGLIFFTLVFGVALTRIPREKAEPVLRVLAASTRWSSSSAPAP